MAIQYIYFYTPRCTKCKEFEEQTAKLERLLGPQLRKRHSFLKLNAESVPKLAKHCEVATVPMVFAIEGDEILERHYPNQVKAKLDEIESLATQPLSTRLPKDLR